jgi:antitoxin component YwqK of YwqJK toxin-antitoxin module
MWGCSPSSEEATNGNLAGVLETFPETPGVVRTQIRDAADLLLSTGYYLNGKKEGSWVDYYPSRMMKSLTTYIQDHKEGIALEFEENSSVSKKYFYHNDKLHGEYLVLTGAVVREEKHFENGLQTGVARAYYENGLLQEESYYKEGKRHGASKWYDKDGLLTIQYEYKDGELIKM